MPDEHYVNPKLAELYDLDSPWSSDRDFYLSLAGTSAQNILDLGCGTGLLCNAYAERGHRVTGVDPSLPMLEVGRKKRHGNEIEWVQSSAQSLRLHRQFDLIIMTGHAFQVLLEDSDILETFSMMREHLKPNGLIAFESRNPLIDWPEIWDYDLVLRVEAGIVHESRRFQKMEGDRMTFELRYDFPDEKLVSTSQLRFLSRHDIEQRLTACSLGTTSVLGNWDREPFNEDTSHEIILLCRHGGKKPHW